MMVEALSSSETSVPPANLHNIPSQKTCGYCNNLIWPVGARMMVKLDKKNFKKWVNTETWQPDVRVMLNTQVLSATESREDALVYAVIRHAKYMRIFRE
jgi:hypothetical protein